MRDPVTLTLDEIEDIERLSLRAFFIAAMDFGLDAWEIFRQSHDDPKDIAEDTTREMLERFGGYEGYQRLFGNVDCRKARRIILPEYGVNQALFVDSKAEKSDRNATIQMSQTSMMARMAQIQHISQGEEQGKINVVETYGSNLYLTTTLIAHYYYASSPGEVRGRDTPPYLLKRLTLVALPNGQLQERYNPNPNSSFWHVGRHSPQRGESFRVRVDFQLLKAMAKWRVQRISYDASNGKVSGTWDD